MEKFKEYLEGKGFSYSTIETGIRNLIIFFQWMKENRLNERTLTYEDLLLFMNYCKENKNQKISVNLKMRYVGYYMDFLVKENKRDRNPVIRMRQRGVVKKVLSGILTNEELETIYKSYNNISLVGKRNKTILGLMIYHGLTTKEIEKLTLYEIDIANVQITIPGSRKSNSRVLKLESALVLVLADYINNIRPQIQSLGMDKSDRLFLNTGKANDLYYVFRWLQLDLKRSISKLPNLKHIRNSVISNWLDKHDERTVQYMSGLKYLSSLERFKQTDLKELQRDLELIHPLNDL